MYLCLENLSTAKNYHEQPKRLLCPTVHKYSRFYQQQLLFDFKLSDHFSDYCIGPNKHCAGGEVTTFNLRLPSPQVLA